jgi:sugar fermentation stimulation protein A
MTFDELIPGVLRRRYKRFLADVELAGGDVITAHCPNTGAMTGCAEPGSPVWLSVSDSRTRKYPHTWELVETVTGMACIHSARANAVVEEAVREGRIAALAGYAETRREVRYGRGSRADLQLLDPQRGPCTIEIKSVTLCREDGVGVFPDAVSDRARKHLDELRALARAGERAVIFFCVFHAGINCVQPARDIDPAYCEALHAACEAGVETMAWRAAVTPVELVLEAPLPVDLSP